MAITINGSGITSANIADGAIVNADVSDLAASKLTGALPAISGASLTSLTSSQVDSGSTTAKAWVNFNGTGTVAIRAAYNVSSITDNGTGNYTVNFTTTMVDADYCANITYANSVGSSLQLRYITRGTTSEQRFFVTADGSVTGVDTDENNVSIFR